MWYHRDRKEGDAVKYRFKAPMPLPYGRFKLHYGLYVMTYDGPPLPEESGFFFPPYRDSGYRQLQKLEAEAFLPMRQQLDRRPHYLGPSASDYWFHCRNRSDIVLCTEGKTLIAAGYALRRDRMISGVVTHPDHRRKGAAKAVVCRCVNHLLADRPGPITLTVVTINDAAIKLYQSLGFRITGKKTYYRELNEE